MLTIPQVPLLIPCQLVRRNSPEENYILTLTGVKNLIEQQNKIVEEIKNYEKKDEKKVNSDKNEAENLNMSEFINSDKSQTPAISSAFSANNLTRSSSSSMQTLRRILEIEEWRRFSEILDFRMDTMFY